MARLYDFPDDSWVAQSDIVDSPTAEQYFWSLYKALGTMISMETQTPVSTSCFEGSSSWCTIENWTNLISLYMGSVMYALLISNLSSIVLTVEMGQHLLSEKVKQVNEYMRSKRLPVTLRDKVRDFFRLRFAEGKMFNETEILKEISPTLRQEIMRFNSAQLFFKVPIFGNSPETFKYALATTIQPVVHFDEEVVFKMGTTGEDLYFIYSGVVQIEASWFEHGEKPLAVIGDGCYFGDVALLLLCKRTATAVCKSLSFLYAIDNTSLSKTLADHKHVYKYMLRIAECRQTRVLARNPNIEDVTEDELTPSQWFDDEDEQTELFSLNNASQSKPTAEKAAGAHGKATSVASFTASFRSKKGGRSSRSSKETKSQEY